MKKPAPNKRKSPKKKFSPGKEFGPRYQGARLAHGSSQCDVAITLNSDVTTISRYELGIVQPSVVMAAAMANAIGASLDQLCSLNDGEGLLVELARALQKVLSPEHRRTLEDQLRMLLALAGKA